jgi:hypothetical protein
MSLPIILKKEPPNPIMNMSLSSSSNSEFVEWVRKLLQVETEMERLKPEIQSIQEKREIARNELLKRIPNNGQIETPYGKILIQTIESSPTMSRESVLEWIRKVTIPGTFLPNTTTINKSFNELLEEDYIKYISKNQQGTSRGGYRRLTFISNHKNKHKKTRRKSLNSHSHSHSHSGTRKQLMIFQ